MDIDIDRTVKKLAEIKQDRLQELTRVARVVRSLQPADLVGRGNSEAASHTQTPETLASDAGDRRQYRCCEDA